MFSLANFQVVHLVTSEFFQQGDLERTTLKMEPSVSTEGEEDRGDFGDGHRAETTNWAKGCGKIRVCPFICFVTLLNSQLNLALVVKHSRFFHAVIRLTQNVTSKFVTIFFVGSHG